MRLVDAFAILGDPALNRVQFFAAAASAAGVPIEIVSYREIGEEGSDWRARLAGRRVRLESPGRDCATERALLRRGAVAGVEPNFSRVAPDRLESMLREPGRVFATRQWYLGYVDLLNEIAAAAGSNGASFLNSPADVAVMFDKRACHARLAAGGVPVPRALATPESFAHVIELMTRARLDRVFLKTCHGSGANGVLALERRPYAIQGTTALQVDRSGGETKVFATRRLRVYRDSTMLRRLVDALCRERLHVEEWVPKAGVAGRTADVRVVVIGGRACHLALRLAEGPITNLHLSGAKKGGEELLVGRGGLAAATLVRRTAEQAAACFPTSLCVGVDVALTPSFRQARVLEVNAFGDLLEGVAWRGFDTYTWAIRAALNRDWPPL